MGDRESGRARCSRRRVIRAIRWPYSEGWLCHANDNGAPWGEGVAEPMIRLRRGFDACR